MKNNGGPAFPTTPHVDMHGNRGPQKGQLEGGLTVRDYFAGCAISAIAAQVPSGSPTPPYYTAEGMAKRAYTIAEAMLKERNKLD